MSGEAEETPVVIGDQDTEPIAATMEVDEENTNNDEVMGEGNNDTIVIVSEKDVEPIVDVFPSEHFNLQEYIGRYSGHTKVKRLLFIAKRCPVYKEDALLMAIEEIKKGINVSLYRKVFELEAEFLSNVGVVYDSLWVDSSERKAQHTHESLEIDLQNNRQNLDKLKIRESHIQVGRYYYDRGEYGNALRSFIRTQDYCTAPNHILDLCMNVIDASTEMENFAHVMNYLPKAEAAVTPEDHVISANLSAISGLSLLRTQKFKNAARKFVHTEFDINVNNILSPQDIAIYGGICALAEFDRGELYRNVVDNVTFKNYLELTPLMDSIINDFYTSNYASCLENLNILKNDLQLDIHIHDDLETLYKQVRNKAIVQYFSPYVSIDMQKMAEAFQTDVKSLEEELSALIMEGVISARIDSYNNRLYAKQSDERIQTFERALEMGENFQRNIRGILIHTNIVRNEMIVKPSKQGPGSHKGGGRHGKKRKHN